MDAVILAGGKGTRLRPYTTVFPKPLMPIGDYPILEVIVRQLKRYGFHRLILAVGPHHELFRAFFGDGRKWGLKIEYVVEDQALGTAGPLLLVDQLEQDFLLMNGDILTDLPFDQLLDDHRAHAAPMTIATTCRSVTIDYGTLEYGPDHRLLGFGEKPRMDYQVSMGVYCLSRSALAHIPQAVRFDFPDLVLALLQAKVPVHCYPYRGFWLDIGRPADYEKAIDEFEQRKGELFDG